MSRILIVDDEKDITVLVTLHLSQEGCEVIAVHNGLEVLETAAKERPQLIVLDIMLPGLDGWQVFRSLRTDARTRSIPVLMLSARSQPRDRINGLEMGADDYLTKPFSPRELVLRIRAILMNAANGIRQQNVNSSTSSISHPDPITRVKEAKMSSKHELTKSP
ncbi:MAG: response regulator transcription factor [Prosthecobacter sp.]